MAICSNCGATIDSLNGKCPACGYEIERNMASTSVSELSEKLSDIEKNRTNMTSDYKISEQKITLIKSFAIPNDREEILKFVVLAAANVDTNAIATYDTSIKMDLSEAWFAKLEQAYNMAKVLYSDEQEFKKLEEVYLEKKYAIDKAREKLEAKRQRNHRNLWIFDIVSISFFIILFIVLFATGVIPADNQSDNTETQGNDTTIIDKNETTTTTSKNDYSIDRSYNLSENQIKLLTNPSWEFIVEHTKDVAGITDYGAATLDDNEDGYVKEDEGNTARIYYRYDKVPESDIEDMGDNPIDIGTDGGACIEIYKTVEDAEARNSYLAAFDGGEITSGGHVVVGTIIIRTSEYLSSDQQVELEKLFIESLVGKF